ncbi:TPA: hypothetical protein DDW35_12820 [Candidatus Sumerlaeota bacterium]|nr:hypothetical protein [Candidatus Sumerlaeota bacterium]
MRKMVVVLAGITTLWMFPLAVNAESVSLLSKDQEKVLPEAARADYQMAAKCIDKINYDGALVSLIEVEKKAPQNAPVRLLVARIAISEARKGSPTEPPKVETDCGKTYCWRNGSAKEKLELAQKSLQEIVDMPQNGVSVKKDDMSSAEIALRQVKGMIESLPKKAEEMATRGKTIADTYKKEMAAAASAGATSGAKTPTGTESANTKAVAVSEKITTR